MREKRSLSAEDDSAEAGVGVATAYAARHNELILAHERPGYQAAKRTFDVAVALAALTALLPLFVVVSVAVLLSGGSPLIFKQTRVGKGGRVFKILKFRTMVRDAEKILQCRPDLLDEYHRTYKIQNDPRITTVGRFLRSTTLDELPQFINVVLGDMSLVGPRPIVPSELALYGDCQDTYLSMKPGCAGLWQCSGRSDLSYGERVALDVTYHRKASIAYDLRILLLTLVSVFGRKGAN